MELFIMLVGFTICREKNTHTQHFRSLDLVSASARLDYFDQKYSKNCKVV